MAYQFKAIRRVEFADTDMAGIMHYSNFFRFMETAEHGFFRALGHSIVTNAVTPPVGWPRVRAQCDYKAPLRFEDEVEIHLLVSEKRSKALTYQFRFYKKMEKAWVLAALGSLTVVCVRRRRDGSMAACAIPAVIAKKIQTAPARLLGGK